MTARHFLGSLISLVLFTAARAHAAGPVQAKHAQVELLSEQPAVQAGKEQLLGVHFVMEKGWHIYWVNPGDSGQPPVFRWQLPAGLAAGAIEWPRPERMQSSPQLADYGYHDDVMLLVPFRVLPSFNPPASAIIRLDAHWLICREVCLPDQAQLELSLPLRSGTNAKTAELFSRSLRLVPKAMPADWKVSVESRKDEFVLSVRAGKSLSAAQFFPLEPSQVDNAAAQKIEPSARGARITLRKSDELLKPIAVLRGVLVLPGDEAYRMEAPVESAKK